MLHNRYRAPGGEERAVANLVEMLARHGHAVRLLERSSAELSRFGAAAAMTGGGLAPDAVGRAVTEFGADVVHAHNVHPLFGWRALQAAGGPAPGSCCTCTTSACSAPSGSRFATGCRAFRCGTRNTLPGLVHRCRGPVSEAAVYAAGLSLQQPRLLAHADRFITVSRFTAAKLIEHGLPADRTDVLPNFTPRGSVAEHSRAAVGRIRPGQREAGAREGLRHGDRRRPQRRHAARDRRRRPRCGTARSAWRPTRTCGSSDGWTRRGWRSCVGARRCVWCPSRCDEACPYAAIEALADGVPVIGSTRGGLPELLERQLVVDADDASAWGDAAGRLWSDAAARSQLGARALQTARELLSEERYHAELMRIYDQARVNRRPATGD